MSESCVPWVYRPFLRTALPISDLNAFWEVSSKPRSAAKGDCLIKEGAEFSSLIILCRGMARKVRTLSDGIEQIVAVFVEGDVLNSGEVVFRQSRNSVYALTDVTYLSVPVEKLNALIASRPAIGLAMWRETAAQAAIQQEWMIWLAKREAQSRLAHLLCELSYRLQISKRTSDTLVEFPLTQRDIADALGMSTVHVNRTLQVLRSQGLIELSRSRLAILDREGLYAVAEFDPQYLEMDIKPLIEGSSGCLFFMSTTPPMA